MLRHRSNGGRLSGKLDAGRSGKPSSRIFDEVTVSRHEVIGKIWYRLKLYLRIEWKKILQKITMGKITLAKGRWLFMTDYWSDPLMYQFVGQHITVPLNPPRA